MIFGKSTNLRQFSTSFISVQVFLRCLKSCLHLHVFDNNATLQYFQTDAALFILFRFFFPFQLYSVYWISSTKRCWSLVLLQGCHPPPFFSHLPALAHPITHSFHCTCLPLLWKIPNLLLFSSFTKVATCLNVCIPHVFGFWNIFLSCFNNFLFPLIKYLTMWQVGKCLSCAIEFYIFDFFFIV